MKLFKSRCNKELNRKLIKDMNRQFVTVKKTPSPIAFEEMAESLTIYLK